MNTKIEIVVPPPKERNALDFSGQFEKLMAQVDLLKANLEKLSAENENPEFEDFNFEEEFEELSKKYINGIYSVGVSLDVLAQAMWRVNEEAKQHWLDHINVTDDPMELPDGHKVGQ